MTILYLKKLPVFLIVFTGERYEICLVVIVWGFVGGAGRAGISALPTLSGVWARLRPIALLGLAVRVSLRRPDSTLRQSCGASHGVCETT